MRLRFLGRLTAATLAVGLAALPTAANAAPNPQLDRDQWWFDTWSVQQEVWPLTKGKGVTVGVIDSGVSANLPEFRGGVLEGTNVIQSGSGQKDLSDDGHGTAMSALIASRGGRVTGLAPEAKILPITAWKFSDKDLAAAIRYGVDHGAKVINMSVGRAGTADGSAVCPDEIFDAVAYAAKKDVVLVSSAGNSGAGSNMAEYPGSCPGVLAVGAIQRTGAPWDRTQRQPYVKVAAPGDKVRSVDASGKTWLYKGTSVGSALTSGAAALVRAHRPDLSARQVVQILTNTAKDVGPSGKDDQTGYGLVSIRRSLRENVPASAPNPVYAELDKALAAKGKPAASTSGKPSAAEQEDSGGSGMLLVGGVVVVLLIAGGVIGFVLLRKKPKQPTPPQHGMPPNFGAPGGYPPPPNQQPHQSGGYPLPPNQQQPPGGVQAPPPPPPGH